MANGVEKVASTIAKGIIMIMIVKKKKKKKQIN